MLLKGLDLETCALEWCAVLIFRHTVHSLGPKLFFFFLHNWNQTCFYIFMLIPISLVANCKFGFSLLDLTNGFLFPTLPYRPNLWRAQQLVALLINHSHDDVCLPMLSNDSLSTQEYTVSVFILRFNNILRIWKSEANCLEYLRVSM